MYNTKQDNKKNVKEFYKLLWDFIYGRVVKTLLALPLIQEMTRPLSSNGCLDNNNISFLSLMSMYLDLLRISKY